MPPSDTLTSKQRAFLAEYLKDHNAAAAARRAGYAEGSARRIGSDLLAKPHIKAELATLESELLDRIGVTAEQVLRQIQRIAFFDIATIYKKTNVLKGHQYKCRLCGYEEYAELGEKLSSSHGPEQPCRATLTVTEQYDVRRTMIHPSEWPAQARAALASMDTVIRNLSAGDGIVDTVLKVKLESKLQALDLLANHFGLTKEAAPTTNVQIIQWLPPEPPPDLRLESNGSPDRSDLDLKRLESHPASMGFEPARPDPLDRTQGPTFLSGGSGYTAESEEDPEGLVGNSGMSRRAQERMFPELRKGKPRV